MEKKYCLGIIIVIVIVVILAGLYIAVDEPDVTVTRIRYNDMSTSPPSISFYVTLTVFNDNPLGATLKKVEADISIDGKHMGNAYSEDEFDIEANAETEISVVLRVTDVPTDILGKSSVMVRVDGIAYLKVWFFDFEVPFVETSNVELSYTYPLPK